MIYPTKGIVVRSYKYSETSLIAHIYTRDFGMLSFLISGARSQKAKIKASYFQHLTLVDMEIYFKSNRQLQKIKELTVSTVFQTIPHQIEKTSIAMFIAEVLNKTLHEEANETLFEYLSSVIRLLDNWQNSLSNFPLGFITNMAHYWGIMPYNNYDPNFSPHFHLYASSFSAILPHENYGIYYPDTHYLSKILKLKLDQVNTIQIPSKIRHELLTKMLDYCRLHLAHFSRIQSIGILKEVLR